MFEGAKDFFPNFPKFSGNSLCEYFTIFGMTSKKRVLSCDWNFYYDAKKLLQVDDCVMITSN